jgi:HSP20 family protein
MFEQSLTRNGSEPVSTQTWAPRVDIVETEEALKLHAELPGVKPEDIDIQITGDVLTLKGERKFEQEVKEKQYIRVERAYGAFNAPSPSASPSCSRT